MKKQTMPNRSSHLIVTLFPSRHDFVSFLCMSTCPQPTSSETATAQSIEAGSSQPASAQQPLSPLLLPSLSLSRSASPSLSLSHSHPLILTLSLSLSLFLFLCLCLFLFFFSASLPPPPARSPARPLARLLVCCAAVEAIQICARRSTKANRLGKTPIVKLSSALCGHQFANCPGGRASATLQSSGKQVLPELHLWCPGFP